MSRISVTTLNSFAGTNDGKNLAGEIVSRLIWYSIKSDSITSKHFLYGDANGTAGFDGDLSVKEGKGQCYVPEGNSIWEFGCAEDSSKIPKKIRDDIEKRANGINDKTKPLPEGWQSLETSYIAVTLNKLNDKTNLQNQLSEEHKNVFKKIKILDAQDIIDWLALAIPVNVWLYEKIMGEYPNIKTLERFWDLWKGEGNCETPSELLICDRQKDAEDLKQLLANDENIINIIAYSPEEATAFVHAVVKCLTDEEKSVINFGLHDILVLDSTCSQKEFESINHSQSPAKAVVLLPPATEYATKIKAKKVICALGDKSSSIGRFLSLKPSNIYNFARILENKLQQEYNSAIVETKKCGGNVTLWQIMKNSSHDYSKQFKWVDSDVVPLIFIRAWSPTNIGDKEIVGCLSDKTYDDYFNSIEKYRNCENPLFSKEGMYYALIAPTFAFQLVMHKINQQHLLKLEKVLLKVFTEEISNSIETAESDEMMSFITTPPKYSKTLKDGLAETLLNIAAYGDCLVENDFIDDKQSFVNSIITKIPNLKNDIRVMNALRDQIPVLFEAAPEPFLDAIDALIDGYSENIKAVFNDKGIFGGFSDHTYYLWGLETLAWSPEYTGRVCDILYRLAELDPGGKTSNRPIMSLHNILSAWSPCTYSPLELRLEITKSLVQKNSDVSWQLVKSLLPKYAGGVMFPNRKPKFKDFGYSESKTLTRQNVISAFDYYTTQAIELAFGDIKRLEDILDIYYGMHNDNRDIFINKLKEFTKKINNSDKNFLAETLIDFIDKNMSYYESAEWAVKPDELEVFKDILAKLNYNIADKEKFELFNSRSPRVMVSKYDYEKYSVYIKNKRESVIMNLIQCDSDYTQLLKFIKQIQLKGDAASITAKLLNIKDTAKLFKIAVADTELLDSFIPIFVSVACERLGNCWLDELDNIIKEKKLSEEAILLSILRLNDTLENYEWINKLGNNISEKYWKQRVAIIYSDDKNTIKYALDKLANVERLYEALTHFSINLKLFTPEEILSLLQKLKQQAVDISIIDMHSFRCTLNLTFDYLRKSDINRDEIAILEYYFLPILDINYTNNNLVIYDMISKTPELFVKLLCDRYKNENTSNDEENNDNNSRCAIAYRLLESWKIVPGFSKDNCNKEELNKWIDESIELAKKQGRETGAYIEIGKILRYAPIDPNDKLWPHSAVRDIIERLNNQIINDHIRIEVFNSRGVVTKEMDEGNEQECELANYWNEHYKKMPYKYKVTRCVLKSIVDMWKYEAENEDKRLKGRRVENLF